MNDIAIVIVIVIVTLIDIPALVVDGGGLDGGAGDSWTTKRARSQNYKLRTKKQWKMEDGKCKVGSREIRWVRQDVCQYQYQSQL